MTKGTPEDKIYLGDGVYACVEKGMLRLETQRDTGLHYIYLEPEVCNALFDWCREHVVIDAANATFEVRNT